MTKKLLAELLGTFILVFFGCGAAVLMGPQIGMLGISLAFGLSIVAAAYSLGAISGAHLNPAVSLGFLMAGRMPMAEFGGYVLAQIAGALLGSLVVFLIASGKAGYVLATDGLGQNGFGAGYLGEYSMGAALIFELIATFVFVSVILAATASHVSSASTALAGLAIGPHPHRDPSGGHQRDRRLGQSGAVAGTRPLRGRQGALGPLGLHRGAACRRGGGGPRPCLGLLPSGRDRTRARNRRGHALSRSGGCKTRGSAHPFSIGAADPSRRAAAS